MNINMHVTKDSFKVGVGDFSNNTLANYQPINRNVDMNLSFLHDISIDYKEFVSQFSNSLTHETLHHVIIEENGIISSLFTGFQSISKQHHYIIDKMIGIPERTFIQRIKGFIKRR